MTGGMSNEAMTSALALDRQIFQNLPIGQAGGTT